MNRQNHPDLIVSGIHLELTPSLKTFVGEKVERLFRHAERIIRVRVELEFDPRRMFPRASRPRATSPSTDRS